MEAIAQSPNISHDTYLRIQITLDVLVAAVVVIRLLTNYGYTRKLAIDDFFSAVAVVMLTGYSSSSFLMTRSLVNPETTVPSITKISVACLFTGGAAMYFSKAPLLLLYIRIFGIHKWLRVACYLTLAATAVIFLVCALYSGVNCIPSGGVYDAPFLLKCMTNTFTPALCRCFTSIFTDIIALSLPLAVVAKLHLPRARKIGLAVVFMSGIFAIVAGCVSLYYQWKMKRSSNASDMTVAMLCTCIECAIAIIVGCAPALHCLWTNYIAKSPLITNLKLSYPSRSRGTNLSDHSQKIKVTTHHYIELGDVNKAAPTYQANVTGVNSGHQGIV